jgi:Ni/Co efflux regulator RcnB
MRKIVITGFAAALLAAGSAQAASSDNNNNNNTNRSESARDQSQANGGSRSAERRICVREPRSGSHLSPQVCHTEREWRDLQGNDSDHG